MLKKLLYTDEKWFTLPIRLALGVIFIAHGSQKLFGLFGGYGLTATANFFAEKLGMHPAMLWATLAALGEFGGGVLVLLGLCTRFGALNLAIVMSVAMLHVHWGAFFLPAGIEYTLALLCASLSLMIAGGGKYSVDALLQKKL
jgi:putative oxidoreductase